MTTFPFYANRTKKCVSIFQESNDEQDAFFLAAKHNRIDVLRQLKQKTAQLKDMTKARLFTPRYLYGRGVDPGRRDSDGYTALWYAADRGQEAAVRYLLSLPGVDADAKTTGGMTPLHVAARAGATGVARALVKAGASINARCLTCMAAFTHDFSLEFPLQVKQRRDATGPGEGDAGGRVTDRQVPQNGRGGLTKVGNEAAE